MDHFSYRDGKLFCEEADLAGIASSVGTPTYVYSASTLEVHYDRFAKSFAPLKPLICFSVKCCSNIHVLKVLAGRGAGMDVVSGGELARALAAGVAPEKIVYAGVGKTDEEIRLALRPVSASGSTSGPIGLFNIESEPEFEVLASAARSMNVTARACLRVNPDVAAGGHAYISTGKADTKFGVPIAHARTLLERFARERHLKLSGVHIHIGSSITDPGPYVEAIKRVLELIDALAAQGVVIDTLNLGGGYGADYSTGQAPPAQVFADAIVPLLERRVEGGLKIILEPGRSIAANAGVLLTRVLFVKLAGHKKFIVADAGMHTLLRPALYNAFHFIWPASVSPAFEPARRELAPDMPGLEVCDVVGPVCETGDFFAKDRKLPPTARGDLLAVFTAGAYGMSMASRYNSHPLPAEVLVRGSSFAVIRPRETHQDLFGSELSVKTSL